MNTARDSIAVYLNQIGADTLPLYGIGDRLSKVENGEEVWFVTIGVYWAKNRWKYLVFMDGQNVSPPIPVNEEEIIPF